MAERIIQLAKNLDALSLKAKTGLFDSGYASEKLDGVWVAAVYDGGTVTFFSSTLEEYISLNDGELEASIKELGIHSWTNFVLISEAYIPGREQQEISGLCRKQVRGHASEVQLHVHDILSIEEWQRGKSERFYKTRLMHLQAMLGGLETSHLKLIPQQPISSEQEFKDYAANIQRQAGEGACFRPSTALWESGNRGTNLVRIKELITYDLEVVRVGEVGVGAKGGLTGVIYVRWRQGAVPTAPAVEAPVRGMSHDELRAWSADPALIVGKIVEVHAMKFTNLGMLREPRFKCIREDKVVADL